MGYKIRRKAIDAALLSAIADLVDGRFPDSISIDRDPNVQTIYHVRQVWRDIEEVRS